MPQTSCRSWKIAKLHKRPILLFGRNCIFFSYARHTALSISSVSCRVFMLPFYLFYFTRLFFSVNDFFMFLLPLDVKLSISDSSQSRICVRDLYRIGNQSALQKNDINACDMSRFRFFKQRIFFVYYMIFYLFFTYYIYYSLNVVFKNNIFFNF